MAYNFSSLSPPDFEDLSRDLIGEAIGVRFEGFSAGPDGGIDGRHASSQGIVVLQAKHYLGSSFASLRTSMTREGKAIGKIRPQRYLLSTSHPLNPAKKAALTAIIGRWLRRSSDIFGPAELNHLLRKFSGVEKAHIKLWLSSSAVLQRVVRSAIYEYTAASRSEIEAKVRVYAQNPSFKQARDKLEANRMLIISGPPGVESFAPPLHRSALRMASSPP